MTTTSSSVREWLKYLFPDELSHLKNLASSLPPGPIIVNIGAGGGTSGLAFMEEREDAVLFTIDITDGSSPFGCLEAERTVFKQAGFPTKSQRWFQIHGSSTDILWSNKNIPVTYAQGEKTDEYAKVNGRQPNMVFIDGDHSYFGCASDIEIWWKRLAPGGVMAVHDFSKDEVYDGKGEVDRRSGPHPQSWPGVDMAVREFIEMGEYSSWYNVDTLAVFWKSYSSWSAELAFSRDLKKLRNLKPGQPCSAGCQGHVTHPCHICGRKSMGLLSASPTDLVPGDE